MDIGIGQSIAARGRIFKAAKGDSDLLPGTALHCPKELP